MNHNNQQEQQSANLPAEQQSTDKGTQVSAPATDRPHGPFEHSGETARQTEAERQEESEEA